MRISSFNSEFLQEWTSKPQQHKPDESVLQVGAEIALEYTGNDILLHILHAPAVSKPSSPEILPRDLAKMVRKGSQSGHLHVPIPAGRFQEVRSTYIFNRKAKIFIEHFDMRYNSPV